MDKNINRINEYQKDFDGWNSFKKELEILESPLLDKKTGKYLFKEGQIWFCSLGVNVGTEICGKNKDFERPVLIIRKSKRHYICLPLTSQKPTNLNFYHDISYQYTDKNNNTSTIISSFVILSNPMSLDVLRLSRKVKRIKDEELILIRAKLSNYIQGLKP